MDNIYLFQMGLRLPKFMLSAMNDFDIDHFPFLDGDARCSTFYGVYISQFAGVSSIVTDFNASNKISTANLLQQDVS